MAANAGGIGCSLEVLVYNKFTALKTITINRTQAGLYLNDLCTTQISKIDCIKFGRTGMIGEDNNLIENVNCSLYNKGHDCPSTVVLLNCDYSMEKYHFVIAIRRSLHPDTPNVDAVINAEIIVL